MIVYNYHPVTKEYLGQSVAHVDPMRLKLLGETVYLLPANATFTAPPSTTKNQIAIYDVDKDKWEKVKDYRGMTVYNKETRQPVVWQEIGPLPSGYVTKLPKCINEEFDKAIKLLKEQHKACLDKLIHFDDLDLDFKYSSMQDINVQLVQGFPYSRDESNKIYYLTDEQLNYVKEFLYIYGQLAYIYKWQFENALINSKTIDKINSICSKMKIEVNTALVKDLMALTEEKRRNYFTKLIEDFNK